MHLFRGGALILQRALSGWCRRMRIQVGKQKHITASRKSAWEMRNLWATRGDVTGSCVSFFVSCFRNTWKGIGVEADKLKSAECEPTLLSFHRNHPDKRDTNCATVWSAVFLDPSSVPHKLIYLLWSGMQVFLKSSLAALCQLFNLIPLLNPIFFCLHSIFSCFWS